jgi:hypothetical protein
MTGLKLFDNPASFPYNLPYSYCTGVSLFKGEYHAKSCSGSEAFFQWPTRPYHLAFLLLCLLMADPRMRE